jgi:hypothetical protein
LSYRRLAFQLTPPLVSSERIVLRRLLVVTEISSSSSSSSSASMLVCRWSYWDWSPAACCWPVRGDTGGATLRTASPAAAAAAAAAASSAAAGGGGSGCWCLGAGGVEQSGADQRFLSPLAQLPREPRVRLHEREGGVQVERVRWARTTLAERGVPRSQCIATQSVCALVPSSRGLERLRDRQRASWSWMCPRRRP